MVLGLPWSSLVPQCTPLGVWPFLFLLSPSLLLNLLSCLVLSCLILSFLFAKQVELSPPDSPVLTALMAHIYGGNNTMTTTKSERTVGGNHGAAAAAALAQRSGAATSGSSSSSSSSSSSRSADGGLTVAAYQPIVSLPRPPDDGGLGDLKMWSAFEW